MSLTLKQVYSVIKKTEFDNSENQNQKVNEGGLSHTNIERKKKNQTKE